MPLVSVRLPESTKQRMARQAILQGNTHMLIGAGD